MTRFDLDMDGSMEPSENGRWVRYEDVVQRKWQGLTDDEMQKIIKLVAKKCAEIADTAEPYQSADLIRKHFGVEK